jgi:hypothetical protein
VINVPKQNGQTLVTVGVLRHLLEEFNDSSEVWVASDGEGNSFGVPTLECGIGGKGGKEPLVLYPVMDREP